MEPLIVDPAEAGTKLLRFLEKHLAGSDVSPAVLHRWVRTGQVRRNGGRAQPFARLEAGDRIRIPPFALPEAPGSSRAENPPAAAPRRGERLSPLLRVHAVTPDILVLEKSAGLPSQPGSGHTVSVVSLLRERFAALPFIPAPAHRLDKATSGLVLAGRTHEAQRFLHEALASGPNRGKGATKEYLAWCSGIWPKQKTTTLRDMLVKETEEDGRERMRLTGSSESESKGKEALCRVTPLQLATSPKAPASLLLITLETGRSHQIRVQLAGRGHPIIGDGKYGGRPFPLLLLHAFRVGLPARPGQEEQVFVAPPDWPEPFAVHRALKREH